MRTMCSIAACALIALCAMPAAAQSERSARNATSFRYVDVTPDLAVTKRAATVHVFDVIDGDGDGKLDDAELSSEAAQRYDWIAMDTDGNGHITLAEFTALQPRAIVSRR